MATVEFKQTDVFTTRKAFLNLENVNRFTAEGVRQGFFNIGRALEQKASDDILDKSLKTGRIYIIRSVSKKGRVTRRRHQASAPGETHANMTGALRRSIGWKVKGAESLTFEYGADGKTPPVYAAAIEFGRPAGETNGVKYPAIEARPSLSNAIDAISKDAENYFDESIIAELEK